MGKREFPNKALLLLPLEIIAVSAFGTSALIFNVDIEVSKSIEPLKTVIFLISINVEDWLFIVYLLTLLLKTTGKSVPPTILTWSSLSSESDNIDVLVVAMWLDNVETEVFEVVVLLDKVETDVFNVVVSLDKFNTSVFKVTIWTD